MSISVRVAALQRRVFAEEYHIQLWHRVLFEHRMSWVVIDSLEYSDKELVALCNDFWEALPDDESIRTGPFFDLCDICEAVYDEDVGDPDAPRMSDDERHDVAACIDSDGLDYTFRNYSLFEDIVDPEFHRLRQAYINAVDALEAYVESFEDEEPAF